MRVNIDSKALTDPRIKRLALSLGCSWHEALGRSICVWMVCYDQKTSRLSHVDVDLAADKKDFGIALADAGLAEIRGDKIKIKGVTERIEFLKVQKERSLKGVKARTERLTTGLTKRSTTGLSNGPPSGQPNSLALALAPDLALDLKQRERVEITRAWDYARSAHEKLRSTGVDSSSRKWPLLVSGLAATDLRLRFTECREREPDDPEKALAIIFHVVDVATERAREIGSLKYFQPTRLFEAKSFWISAETALKSSRKTVAKTDKATQLPREHWDVYRSLREEDPAKAESYFQDVMADVSSSGVV